jgi:hypothetical protein
MGAAAGGVGRAAVAGGQADREGGADTPPASNLFPYVNTLCRQTSTAGQELRLCDADLASDRYRRASPPTRSTPEQQL